MSPGGSRLHGTQTNAEEPDSMNKVTDKTVASAETATRSDPILDPLVAELPTGGGVGERLRAAGIPLTLQRLMVAQVMLAEPAHLSADQVLAGVRSIMPEISRATVYNALKLFSEKKLVREIVVDAERVMFDSNTSPHYHLYDASSGELTDVPADEIKIIGSAKLPPDLELEDVDVIIRVRRRGGEQRRHPMGTRGNHAADAPAVLDQAAARGPRR